MCVGIHTCTYIESPLSTHRRLVTDPLGYQNMRVLKPLMERVECTLSCTLQLISKLLMTPKRVCPRSVQTPGSLAMSQQQDIFPSISLSVVG